MLNFSFSFQVVILMVICPVRGLYMLEDRLDNAGTDFVLMFMHQKKAGLPLQLHLTTSQPVPVIVRIRTPQALSEEHIDLLVQVYNSNVTIVLLPETLRSSSESERTYKSLLVTSDDVIVLFATSLQHKSTDSTLVYPTDVLSNEYVAVSMLSDKPNPAFIGSTVGVVALEFGMVSIYLPDGITVLFDNITYTAKMHITLNKYEVFHLVTTDVTGIIIKANINLAAFSGHSFIKLGDPSGDHMEVMLPPIQSLGRQYMVAKKPSYQYTPEFIRVVSTSIATNINISDGVSTSAVVLEGKGSYYDFDLPSTGALLTANQSILVAQISRSRCIDGTNGDPSMSLAFSPEFLSSQYTFGVPATFDSNLDKYNLLIVVEAIYLEHVQFDGVYLDPHVSWNNVADSEFLTTEIEDITAGRHTLSSDQPWARLAGVVHGFGGGEHFQTAIGRYLGEPRGQINTTKEENVDVYRQSILSLRYKDYLPSEAPFYNTTSESLLMCFTLCLDYSACYLLATRPDTDDVIGQVICVLYTTVAASGHLQSEPGYTLYRRFA
ncbi:uncharacterized protein LOC110462208 [Mizuhopecten yessoensis]|uniref:IgGFc-binding protein N-terminal domain-containing protein n=1 Tax=Mizuhopecten yessoensis TaxID=6573 RepID=A0A210PYR4_MIZYE|nr:uncharacterized protein LOC110462208 [Mizuhopecten yessoensis]OWF41579.1 hypothetical protein KP79_PYT16360 [Mizuhopecten yessoensis]